MNRSRSYATLTFPDGTSVTLNNVIVMDSAPIPPADFQVCSFSESLNLLRRGTPPNFAEQLRREKSVPVPLVRGPGGSYTLGDQL